MIIGFTLVEKNKEYRIIPIVENIAFIADSVNYYIADPDS
jgi:hypothetical protein